MRIVLNGCNSGPYTKGLITVRVPSAISSILGSVICTNSHIAVNVIIMTTTAWEGLNLGAPWLVSTRATIIVGDRRLIFGTGIGRRVRYKDHIQAANNALIKDPCSSSLPRNTDSSPHDILTGLLFRNMTKATI